MTKVLYPGSFDPITYGHMNIIKQASELFDEVIIAILKNPNKHNSFFTFEERLEMISELYQKMNNIKVVAGAGASVDIAMMYECKAIVRGLRSLSDYNNEVQLQQVNKELSDNRVNTVCLFADSEFQFLSSTVVKEILSLDKPISRYVDPIVENKILTKKRNI